MAGRIHKTNHFGSGRFFISPDQQQIEFNAHSLAALDDTCGFYDLKPLGFGCLVSSVMQMIAVLA